MKPGRKTEEKHWDLGFRHVFNTNYVTDPDLHILLFIAGQNVNDLMRNALREYIANHSISAADPVYQSRVFMQASLQLSQGSTPIARDVLAALNEPNVLDSIFSEQKPRRSTVVRANTPPNLSKTGSPPAAPLPAPKLHEPTANTVASTPPQPAQSKPRLNLDLGPDLESPTLATPVESMKGRFFNSQDHNAY